MEILRWVFDECIRQPVNTHIHSLQQLLQYLHRVEKHITLLVFFIFALQKQFCPKPEAAPWCKITWVFNEPWLWPEAWHPFVDIWTNFNGKRGGKVIGKSVQSCDMENTQAARALACFHYSCHRLLGLTHPLWITICCIQNFTALTATKMYVDDFVLMYTLISSFCKSHLLDSGEGSAEASFCIHCIHP